MLQQMAIDFGITVEKKTVKYVYFTNDTKMTHKEYARYKEGKRKEHGQMYSKWQTVNADEHSQKMDEALENWKMRLMIGSDNPVNALRYVLMYDGKDYFWRFAKRPTSHSALVEEYEKEVQADRYCVGGGFYMLQASNSLQNLSKKFSGSDDYMFKEQILYLFGSSDSYGLLEERFNAAIPYLPHFEEIEVKVMMNNWEFTTKSINGKFI
jgi:hypothetical protein